MAEKRIYVIPLKKFVFRTPYYKRSKKAISTIRSFLSKHMKSDSIKLGRFLNESVWARGVRNPPSKVKVEVSKDAEGVVTAELVDLSPKALRILEAEKKEKEKDKKQSKKSVADAKADLGKVLESKNKEVEKPKDVKPVESKPVEAKPKEVKPVPPPVKDIKPDVKSESS